ncbi:hypothetical protein [Streptomyces sp. NPDC001410]|uniref:hypothetical protein n=1 Tax=Streptomyces sp. NPDC001410 TaxID=3364574 RepID=UPI0036A63D7D
MTEPDIQPTIASASLDEGRQRFDQWRAQRNPEALDGAITAWQRGLACLAVEDERYAGARNDLGMAFHARYQEFGRIADLETAIDMLGDLAAAVVRTSPNRGPILSNLASALYSRYHLRGAADDLSRSRELTERAVRQASISRAERANYYLLLCQVMCSLFVVGEGGSYESCLEALDQAERLSAERGHRERLRALRVHLHMEQYRLTGQQEYLARARAELPDVWDLSGVADWDLPELLILAGDVLSELYELMGRQSVMASARRLIRQALSLVPAGSSQFSAAQQATGWALIREYERAGDISVLEEALTLFRESAVASASAAAEADARSQLGYGLLLRWLRRRERSDLVESVRQCRRAIELPKQSTAAQHHLGLGLLELFRIDHRRSTIDAAVHHMEEAVRTCHRVTTRTLVLHSLGVSLLNRHRRFPSRTDLSRAIEALEDSLAQANAESPMWPATAAMLADALRERYTVAPAAELKDRIDDLYRRAAEASTRGELPAALSIWRARADWSASTGNWAVAAAAYHATTDIGRRLSLTQWTRQDKESWIRDLQGVGARGAYAMIHAGQEADAVLVLELSSAVLLSEALGQRDVDLAELARRCGDDLPDRYRRASERLERLAAATVARNHVGPSSALTAESREAGPGLAGRRSA